MSRKNKKKYQQQQPKPKKTFFYIGWLIMLFFIGFCIYFTITYTSAKSNYEAGNYEKAAEYAEKISWLFPSEALDEIEAAGKAAQ